MSFIGNSSDAEPRCRGCGRKVRLREDGTVGPHKSGRNHQCPRPGTRPAHLPPCFGSECTLDGEYGMVTSGEFTPGVPHAQASVCSKEDHQREAAAWVERLTGVRGEFVARRLQQTRLV